MCCACITQAIKDAKEREMLLEEKEIELFANAKKVSIIQNHMLISCKPFLENDETS